MTLKIATGNENVPDARAIYDAYPRHVAPRAACTEIDRAIARIASDDGVSTSEAAVWLLDRVKRYAQSPLVRQSERTFIPHPRTWFHQDRFRDSDEEWGYTTGRMTPDERVEEAIAEGLESVETECLQAWRGMYITQDNLRAIEAELDRRRKVG